MGIFSCLWGWLSWGGDDTFTGSQEAMAGPPETCCEVNPATGLPMLGGCGGVDVAGNPYGMHLDHHEPWSSCDTGVGPDTHSCSPSSSWDT